MSSLNWTEKEIYKANLIAGCLKQKVKLQTSKTLLVVKV